MNITSLPTLSFGAHDPGQGKACVMEYVSLLAGEEWSDSPKCTNPMLAETARWVNDSLPDSDRHLLVPLIGRLFGTDQATKALTLGLYAWREQHPTMVKMRNAGATCSCSLCENLLPLSPRPTAEEMVGLLSDCIDKYDEAVGRAEHREITEQEYADLAEAVTA